jgi:3-oxoacyl-[acyl-carrier protein] reductase
LSGGRQASAAAGRLGCLVVGDETALAVAVAAGLEAAGAQVARAPAAGSRAEAAAAVARAAESVGEIAALVSCPPAGAPASLDELTPAVFDAALATSFRSPFLYTQAALPALRASRRGRLVYVTSTLGINARPHTAHLAAAARAVIALMRTAALETGPTVTANAIAAAERPTDPASVVDSLLWILRPESDYLTGQVLTTAGAAELHA